MRRAESGLGGTCRGLVHVQAVHLPGAAAATVQVRIPHSHGDPQSRLRPA